MVGGRFIRSCNDVVDLSSHNDRHTEKGAGWDGCIFGSGKRSRNILLPTPWLCVFFSLIVDPSLASFTVHKNPSAMHV